MTTTKARTNVQENQSLTVKSVMVNDKQSAVFLVPDMTEGQKLAVVDEGVLKYLKSLLPKANPYEIINNFIKRMEDIRNNPCTLEDAVKECQDFVAFHTTVNLLKTYFDPSTTVDVEEPFNKTPKPLTFNEMVKKSGELYKQLEDLGEQIVAHPNYKEQEKNARVVATQVFVPYDPEMDAVVIENRVAK